VLLPLYRATHRWKDRKKILHLPVFPCYLFIRGDLDRKVEILKTPGVFWFVESGGRACEIPDSDVDGVRKIVESSAHVVPHRFLKSGEYVRISRGPLAGVQGILTRVKNNIRVVLSVDALQRGIAVEVDLSMVEPLAAFLACDRIFAHRFWLLSRCSLFQPKGQAGVKATLLG
jgi:transcription antitermination factor NusG